LSYEKAVTSIAAMPLTFTALDDLAGLKRDRLTELHSSGECPDLAVLQGRAGGIVLTVPVVRGLRLWRGKVFTSTPEGGVGGLNRLGAANWETLRCAFVARIGESRFADRQVVLLDHDQPGNPPYIRRFHDEMVQLSDTLFLATSHIRALGQLRYVCHFALQLPSSTVGT